MNLLHELMKETITYSKFQKGLMGAPLYNWCIKFIDSKIKYHNIQFYNYDSTKFLKKVAKLNFKIYDYDHSFEWNEQHRPSIIIYINYKNGVASAKYRSL